jgi:hypothetical protein
MSGEELFFYKLHREKRKIRSAFISPILLLGLLSGAMSQHSSAEELAEAPEDASLPIEVVSPESGAVQPENGKRSELAYAAFEEGDVAGAVPVPSAVPPDNRSAESVRAFSNDPRDGTTSLRGAIGFTEDPDTFLLAFEGNYYVNHHVAFGPLLQLGVADKRVLVAPTLNLRGAFDLGIPDMAALQPFVQGGLGLAYLNRDNRRGDDDDVGFLLNFGFGVDYYVRDDLSIGSDMLFNVLPDETLGENFFFSWRVVSLSFHF